MTEFTTSPNDAVIYCNFSDAEILSSYGRYNEHCISIKYNKRIGRNRTQITYWAVGYIELFRSYMKMVPMYNQQKEKWDEAVHDVFKVEVDKDFVSNMGKVFDKHSWIKTAFPCDPHKMPVTDFSRVWRSGTDSIIGILSTARLIGNSDELMYENYKDPTDPTMPVSARIGKHGVKDCLYKINQEVYPDFHVVKPYEIFYGIETGVLEWKGRHLNKSELSRYYEISKVDNIWADKLKSWYMYRDPSDGDTRPRLVKSARKTIYDSLLLKGHKKEENKNLDVYDIYTR